MAEKPDFDKIFANKATSVHEWDKDDYDTGWGFLGETPPPYELFDALQRENDNKTKYLSERAEEINTDLTQDINDLQSDLNNKYSELKTGLGGANTALQQHNVDEDAHANLFQRALVTEAKTAANTADWNTLTESRTYKISGATFSATYHQPVGAVGTGELVVLKNGDDTIAQVYYANSAAYDKAGAYHRMCIGGAWTDWVYNITNKGGVVTGDFNINGKLTVDEVQVTDKLLIGEVDPAHPDTSNFLTREDLQKLQDRIINPTQDIYVSPNGSDETGDGTASKPFATMNKAILAVNKQVPTINIYLDCRTQSNVFYVDPIDMFRQTQINYFNIRPWTTNVKYRATLYVNYGKVQVRDDSSAYGGNPARYAWGNILFSSLTFGENNNVTFYLYQIDIHLSTRKTSDREEKFLVSASSFIAEECSFDIDDYDLFQPVEGICYSLKITDIKENTTFNKVISNKIFCSNKDPNIEEVDDGYTDVKNFVLNRMYVNGKIPAEAVSSPIDSTVNSDEILYKLVASS